MMQTNQDNISQIVAVSGQTGWRISAQHLSHYINQQLIGDSSLQTLYLDKHGKKTQTNPKTRQTQGPLWMNR